MTNHSNSLDNIYIIDYAITTFSTNPGNYEITVLAYNSKIDLDIYQIYKTTLKPDVTDINWIYLEAYYDMTSYNPGEGNIPGPTTKSLYMSNLSYPNEPQSKRLFLLDLLSGMISYTIADQTSNNNGWHVLELPEKEDVMKHKLAPLKLSLFISSNGYIYFSTINKVYRSGKITSEMININTIGWNKIFDLPVVIIKGTEKLLVMVLAYGVLNSYKYSTNILYISNLDDENEPDYNFSGIKYTLPNKPDSQIIDVYFDEPNNRIHVVSVPPHADSIASLDILEFDDNSKQFKWQYSFTNPNFKINLVLPASKLTDISLITNNLLGLSSIRIHFAQLYPPEQDSFIINLIDKTMKPSSRATSIIPSKDEWSLFLPHYRNLDNYYAIYLNYDGTLWYSTLKHFDAGWMQLAITNPHNPANR